MRAPSRSHVLPGARLVIRFAPTLDGVGERFTSAIQHLASAIHHIAPAFGGFRRTLPPFARLFAEIFAGVASGRRRVEERDCCSADRAEQERQQDAARAGRLVFRHQKMLTFTLRYFLGFFRISATSALISVVTLFMFSYNWRS